MLDQRAFMETLHSVQEVAKASQKPLSKEEINNYFKDMELSSEQQQMIYEYLSMSKEKTGSEQHQSQERAEGKKSTKKKKSKSGAANANYFQIYLKDISTMPEPSPEQECALYERLLRGDEAVIAEISHHWLKKIVELAEHYTTAQVLIEDLVQEGNMGLLLGLRQFLGNVPKDIVLDEADSLQEEQRQQLKQALEVFVQEGMEQYRQQQEGESNSANTILAKVSLLHEARKVLAEENGTIPSLEELCAYTKISPEEITDILALHSTVSRE